MANRLRDVRVLKRMTQFQLRLQTGINATKISFIERDLLEPHIDDARKLAEALGVKTTELFPELGPEAV